MISSARRISIEKVGWKYRRTKRLRLSFRELRQTEQIITSTWVRSIHSSEVDGRSKKNGSLKNVDKCSDCSIIRSRLSTPAQNVCLNLTRIGDAYERIA